MRDIGTMAQIYMYRPTTIHAFMTLKLHDLARHIAGHCGNNIRAMQCACLLSRFLLQQGLVLEHKPIHRHFNAWPMLTMAACIYFIRIIDCTLAVQVCGSLEAASRQIVYPHYQ